MNRDITGSGSYKMAERFLADALAVGSGQIFDLADLAVAPDDRMLAASGSLMEQLEGLPRQRICLVDLETGELRQVTEGANRDRLPRWDPWGERIAYLSDARKAHDFQLRILTLSSGAIIEAPLPGRWVEALQWSPDGMRILLLAADHGAELAGAQGAVSTPAAAAESPDWAPHVDLGGAARPWRTLWTYDLASGDCRQVSPPGVNVWEACWCGPSHVVCIASDDPSEEAWYKADVRLIHIEKGQATSLYQPSDQLGCISASPSGRNIAFVEAVCSDRLLVAGTLMAGGREGFSPVDTGAVDVTFTAWQGEESLMFAGLRGFETVLGHFEPAAARRSEIWVSAERTFGNPMFPEAAPSQKPGAAVLLAEGYLSPPTLVLASREGERELPFGRPVPVGQACPGAMVERFEWTAPDGLEIGGYLLTPGGKGPHPLVMSIHGGPVWRTRPRYVGRGGYAALLLDAGYAIFQPNPRGSSGQGQDFARCVLGDVGGADAIDLLTGLDRLVERGIADPSRIGVIGGSYGGYMTAWLVTQDQRFAAAIPIAPISDWISGKFTSNVATSLEMMMGGKTPGADTLYLSRSPVIHAERVRTPTLTICGALDRCTPPGQAQEFHRALSFAGAATSVLLTYPGEGHGVRQFPAMIDFCARVVDWFGQHMSAGDGGMTNARARKRQMA